MKTESKLHKEMRLMRKCPRCGSKTLALGSHILREYLSCDCCKLEADFKDVKKVKASKFLEFIRKEEDKFKKSGSPYLKFRGVIRCATPMYQVLAINKTKSIVKYLYSLLDRKKWYSYNDILSLFREDERNFIRGYLEESSLFREFESNYWSRYFEIDYKNKKLKLLAEGLQ